MIVANRLRVAIPIAIEASAANSEILKPEWVRAGLPSNSAQTIAAIIAAGIKLSHCCKPVANRNLDNSKMGTVRINAVTSAEMKIASRIFLSILDSLFTTQS